MNPSQYLAILLVPQVVLTLLDLADRYLPTHETRPPGRLRAAGLAFLASVLALYMAIHVGLMRLLPDPDAIVKLTVARLSAGAGAAASATAPALVLAVVIGFYAGGLVDYLWHRFFSHGRLFFFTHEYHHLPREVFLLLPGVAVRPFAIVSSFPVAVATAAVTWSALALMGQPLSDTRPLFVLLVVHVLIGASSHSSFLRRSRALHRVLSSVGIVSPREHVLHHARDFAGNFGNVTTLWDRLFGTYLDPDDPAHHDPVLGLAYDQDWLGAITLGRAKLPAGLRARFDVGRWCHLASGQPAGGQATWAECPPR